MTTKTVTTGAEKAVPPKNEFKIESVDSATLAEMEFKREWLIKNILVIDQPGVIGGPMKSMKTSTMLDMAISIGTGKPFLGRFPVPVQRRVACSATIKLASSDNYQIAVTSHGTFRQKCHSPYVDGSFWRNVTSTSTGTYVKLLIVANAISNCRPTPMLRLRPEGQVLPPGISPSGCGYFSKTASSMASR